MAEKFFDKLYRQEFYRESNSDKLRDELQALRIKVAESKRDTERLEFVMAHLGRSQLTAELSNDAPHGLNQACVFVFERARWITPTPEQIREYRSNKKIVEKLGGHMCKMEHESAGESPRLSKQDVQEILKAVSRDNPGVKIIEHWNGENCYTMSVGVEIARKAGIASGASRATALRPK